MARPPAGIVLSEEVRWSWFVGQEGGGVKVYSRRSIMPPRSRLSRLRVPMELTEGRAGCEVRPAS